MKLLTFICLLVAAPGWIQSANLPRGIDSVEDEVQGRVLYTGSQLWKTYGIYNKNVRILEELEAERDISILGRHNTTADILVKSVSLQIVNEKLAENGIKYEVMIDDVQKSIDEETSAYISAKRLSGHRMTWNAYYRLGDIYEYLDYLAKTYPHLCTVQTFGYSFEKRPIKLLKISNAKPNNKAIWVNGGIHAREWITPATVTYIIDQFVSNFTSQSAAVQNIDWYITPVLNPDGYEYSHTTERWWRKNRRPHKLGGLCEGVDLNRNFGYEWGGAGSSPNPCIDDYAGSGPFSEPETLAVKNFFQNSTAIWKAFVSFHSYGQYILYPWGYNKALPSDYKNLDYVARKMASAIKSVGGETYIPGPASKVLPYRAFGTSIDWAKGALNINHTYTIELRDKHTFCLPPSQILPTAVENLAAIKVVAEA